MVFRSISKRLVLASLKERVIETDENAAIIDIGRTFRILTFIAFEFLLSIY